MVHLVIKNVGPIREVDVELKRFNFFIGPQSSGKSTIAKVLSTCTWIEKEVCTTLREDVFKSADEFRRMMSDFHKMRGYFVDDSEVCYESDYVSIRIMGNEFRIRMKDGYVYRRKKICYVPAERNVSALQELQGFEFGQTNLRSFLFDWFAARQQYNPENKKGVLGLGVNYYYDKNNPNSSDHIAHSNGQSYDIPLTSASSGLQSIVPLLVMFQYYTGEYYGNVGKTSSLQSEKVSMLTRRLEDELVLKQLYKEAFSEDRRHELINEVNERLRGMDVEAKRIVDKYMEIRNRLLNPVNTTFIVEEPEQNLFPVTQRDVLRMMLGLCTQTREHSLTVTTHSPYILYSLNNCMLSYLVHEKMPEEERTCNPAINPKDVGVWQIDEGGFVSDLGNDNNSIQDERGLIRKNFFDSVMREIMNDFTNMLNYLD